MLSFFNKYINIVLPCINLHEILIRPPQINMQLNFQMPGRQFSQSLTQQHVRFLCFCFIVRWSSVVELLALAPYTHPPRNRTTRTLIGEYRHKACLRWPACTKNCRQSICFNEIRQSVFNTVNFFLFSSVKYFYGKYAFELKYNM